MIHLSSKKAARNLKSSEIPVGVAFYGRWQESGPRRRDEGERGGEVKGSCKEERWMRIRWRAG